MSCLWAVRREGPRDMTDYRLGQSSRPMPRPQLSVMGAGRGGGVGHREGEPIRKAGLSERKWKKKRGGGGEPLKGFCNKMSRFVQSTVPSDVDH